MNDVNWQSEYKQWVGDVRGFLLKVAQAYLSDSPRLPEALYQESLSLRQTAQEVSNRYQGTLDNGYNDDPDWLWLNRVLKFLRELSGIGLSDRPVMQKDLLEKSHEASSLAKEAKRIEEQSYSTGRSTSTSSASAPPSVQPEGKTFEGKSFDDKPAMTPGGVNQSIDDLQKKIKIQWANSGNPNSAEWQQLIVLLDIAKRLYQGLV